ncbi:MAG TPA: hypothetical protein DCQ06_05015 [Myxococcales bacterium]|nr:hypothetical protein [Myxococcales bacterium]
MTKRISPLVGLALSTAWACGGGYSPQGGEHLWASDSTARFTSDSVGQRGRSDTGVSNAGQQDSSQSDTAAGDMSRGSGQVDSGRTGGDLGDSGQISNGSDVGQGTCAPWISVAKTWQVPNKIFDTMTWQWSPLSWITVDLDGDGKAELVQTEDPGNKGHPYGSDATTPHWRVYRGQNDGFASQPLLWTVPSKTFHAAYFHQGQYSWALLDLTADGRPDLVQTEDPDHKGHAFESPQGAYWRVYANTGSGFATKAISWKVPSADFDAYAFAYGKWSWSTIDLNGDGRMDLVHSENPNDKGQAFIDPKGAFWRVYLGGGAGFAGQFTRWAVPTADHDALYAAVGKWGWSTVDANGDGRPDLMHTEDPDNEGQAFGGEQTPHWRLYTNQGSGFSSQAQQWKVPASVFDSVALQLKAFGWSTIDLDRDGWVDLVHSEDPDNSGSAFVDSLGPHWRVYLGSSSGFTPSWTRWAVPRQDVDALWSYGDWGAWGVMDLDGDGCLDWVDTRDPQTKGSAYTDCDGAHWLVYTAP